MTTYRSGVALLFTLAIGLTALTLPTSATALQPAGNDAVPAQAALVQAAVSACPVPPFWIDAHDYGSAGGGFYWDPASGQVWTSERSWHFYAPQSSDQPVFWLDVPAYRDATGGFYWDPVSGQVWTPADGWHVYNPQPCIPHNAQAYAIAMFNAWVAGDQQMLFALGTNDVAVTLSALAPVSPATWSLAGCDAATGQVLCHFATSSGAGMRLLIDNQSASGAQPRAVIEVVFS
jgi:hypothetical protein